MVVRYGPSGGDGEERNRFWNDIDRILDRVGIGHRLYILGDLNGWIGDRTRASRTSAFGVQLVNDNGRRVVKFYAARGLGLSNTYFKHRSLH